MEPHVVKGNLMLFDVIFNDIYFVQWLTVHLYIGIYFELLNYA
jgi:hypothetical protein